MVRWLVTALVALAATTSIAGQALTYNATSNDLTAQNASWSASGSTITSAQTVQLVVNWTGTPTTATTTIKGCRANGSCVVLVGNNPATVSTIYTAYGPWSSYNFNVSWTGTVAALQIIATPYTAVVTPPNPGTGSGVPAQSVPNGNFVNGITNTGTFTYSALPTGNLNYRNAWTANTVYAVNDVITNSGNSYVVTTAFTSGSTFSATNLTALATSSSGGSGVPAQTQPGTNQFVIGINSTGTFTYSTITPASIGAIPADGTTQIASGQLSNAFAALAYLNGPFTIGNTGQAAYKATDSTTSQASQDPALTISYGFTDSNIPSGNAGAAYSHALGFNNTYNRSESNCTGLAACAYAAVDDRTILLGNHNYNHFGSFQAANMVSIGSGNTVSKVIGYIGVPRQTSGTITNLFGMELSDLAQTGGTVVNQTGIHIATQSKATGTTTLPQGYSVANNFGLVVDQSSGGNNLGGNTTISANYNAEGGLVINNPSTNTSAWTGVEVWSVDRNHSFKLGAFGAGWQSGGSAGIFAANTAYYASAAGLTGGILFNTEVNAPMIFDINSLQIAKLSSSGLNLTPSSPGSAGASCTYGDVKVNSTGMYFCVAANSWKTAVWQTYQ